MMFTVIKSMTRHILERAADYEWSVQGFGMLRTYLPGGCRLNVWDSAYRVPHVSDIHTHPWHFESLVIAGSLWNCRYASTDDFGNPNYEQAVIKPGIGGGVMQNGQPVRLRESSSQYLSAGMHYRQDASEIHRTMPTDSCITFNIRERVAADEATVFWPVGEKWVDAMPRIATSAEVADICGKALKIL